MKIKNFFWKTMFRELEDKPQAGKTNSWKDTSD